MKVVHIFGQKYRLEQTGITSIPYKFTNGKTVLRGVKCGKEIKVVDNTTNRTKGVLNAEYVEMFLR